MSSPARSWSPIITAMASWNFSRKRMSSMQVSRGRPHMLTSNQRGRGNEPVTVLGSIRSAVAVNIGLLLRRRGSGRLGALLQRDHIPRLVAGINLARPRDFLFGVFDQFLPLSQPADRTRNGKQHREHLRLEAHGLV